DSQGLTAYSNIMAQGGSQVDVEESILGSPEYIQRHGGANAQLIAAFYGAIFNRTPDAGASAWISQLAEGKSAKDVAMALLHSDEARQDDVRSFYLLYLHRNPDNAGMAAFTRLPGSGVSKEQVITGFL